MIKGVFLSRLLELKVLRFRFLSFDHLEAFAAKLGFEKVAANEFVLLLGSLFDALWRHVLLNRVLNDEFVPCQLKEEEVPAYPLDLFVREDESRHAAAMLVNEDAESGSGHRHWQHFLSSRGVLCDGVTQLSRAGDLALGVRGRLELRRHFDPIDVERPHDGQDEGLQVYHAGLRGNAASLGCVLSRRPGVGCEVAPEVLEGRLLYQRDDRSLHVVAHPCQIADVLQ